MKTSLSVFFAGVAIFVVAIVQFAMANGALAAPNLRTSFVAVDQEFPTPTPTNTPTPLVPTPTPVPPTPTPTPPPPTPTPTFVEIDIKPGSFPNCVNNKGVGGIPVAILSHDGFDATQADPQYVLLEGLGVKVGPNGFQSHAEDVNNDGMDDLVVHIETVAGAFPPGDSLAELTGMTFGGTEFVGVDTICIVS